MKYAPSALIGRLSRSAGATTAAHNRFGAYLRNRVIPTNPQSSAQMAVRGDLTTYSQAWRALTSSQRAGWKALGENVTRSDSLGQTYTLTGQQMYVSCARNCKTYGTTPPSDPPAYSPPANVVTLTITATSS